MFHSGFLVILVLKLMSFLQLDFWWASRNFQKFSLSAQRLYVEWYVGTMVLKFCTIDTAQITFGIVPSYSGYL